MTVTESKDLKKGARVFWRGDAADSGIVTETRWDAVTIAWDNGAGGQRTPRGHARSSASADKAAYCVKVAVISPTEQRGCLGRQRPAHARRWTSLWARTISLRVSLTPSAPPIDSRIMQQ